jgi:hypothetical protein
MIELCQQSPLCSQYCFCEEYSQMSEQEKIILFHKNQMGVINNLIRGNGGDTEGKRA